MTAFVKWLPCTRCGAVGRWTHWAGEQAGWLCGKCDPIKNEPLG